MFANCLRFSLPSVLHGCFRFTFFPVHSIMNSIPSRRQDSQVKQVNSNDIARLAGVSRSTVSRVINGYSNVPEETRKKVMKVIKENHYYPLLSGRLLAGKQTKTLGLFWIGNASIAKDHLTSSYFMHMIDAAARRDYLVLSCIIPNVTDKKTSTLSAASLWKEGSMLDCSSASPTMSPWWMSL